MLDKFIVGKKGPSAPEPPKVNVVVPTYEAREYPNTLSSTQEAYIVDLLSEGPIKGLVNGNRSIFLNGTPLENENGSRNFSGVVPTIRLGEPDQNYIPGFPFVAKENTVNVEITRGNSHTITIEDPNVDRASVKVRVPQLTKQTDKGDIKGSAVAFYIDIQSNGGGFSVVPFDFQLVNFNSSSAATKGLQIVVRDRLSGPAGSWATATWQIEYKKTSSGTWIESEEKTARFKLPSVKQEGWIYGPNGEKLVRTDAVNSQYILNYTENAYIVYDSPPLVTREVNTTFDLLALSSGTYEVRLKQGTSIVSKKYLNPQPLRFSGKTTSPFGKDFTFPLTGDPPWDIRVRRVTADSTSVSEQNQTYFASYTEIIDTKLTYQDRAVMGFKANAEEFGNELPERSYELYGMLIKVPSNYDAVEKTYSGIWDGTFQTTYSNNPAWVFYDILINKRYGLGSYITEDDIDKFALYEIAQYCDEIIDDGFGGTEHRFEFNGVIETREEAYDVLNSIVSCFRGMVYWDSGLVSVTADTPKDPVVLVTNANVIDGLFDYSTTSLKSRHTVVKVSWNNPNLGYKADIAVIEDPEGIRQFGWRELDTVAFGCTSKGQAHRFGKWILDSEKNQTDVVKYQCSLDHMNVRPGNIIKIADEHYVNLRLGGRILDPEDNDLIRIDSEFEFEPGVEYEISITLPDGTLFNSDIINPETTTDVIQLAEYMPDLPIVNAMFVLTTSSVVPRQFQVVHVREIERNIFEITAVNYDPSKFDRVENDIVLDEPDYTTIPTGDFTGPSNLTLNEYLYENNGVVKSAANISWSFAPDARVSIYEVFVQDPEDSGLRRVGATSDNNIVIEDTIPGEYLIQVIPVGGLGEKRSGSISKNFQLYGLSSPPSDIQNFKISVSENVSHLSWDEITDLDLSYYQIRFTPDRETFSWAGSQILIEKVSKALTGISVPLYVGTYSIKAIDTTGNESENAKFIISTVGEIANLNVIETFNYLQNSEFAVKDGVSVISGNIQLTGNDTVDDWPNVDEVENVDIGNDGITTIGYYYPEEIHDNGNIFTTKLIPNIEAYGTDLYSNVDLWENVDNIPNVDGGFVGQWNVEPEISYTSEDPLTTSSWTDYAPIIVGDITARAFRQRLKLVSFVEGVSPIVTKYQTEYDMPDRDEAEGDLTCPVAGLSVVYPEGSFKAIKGLVVTPQDLNQGDYYRITNKTTSGFDINFYNSSNAAIEKTFDYNVKGYGKVLPAIPMT